MWYRNAGKRLRKRGDPNVGGLEPKYVIEERPGIKIRL